MPTFNLPQSDGASQDSAIIGRAATGNPANAVDGQMVAVMADKAGRVVVTETQVRELCKSQTTTITASTSETTIVTATSGVFNDLTGLVITCTGDTVIGTLTLRDTTGGAAKAIFDFPPTAANPIAPVVIDFTPPLSQTAVNTNWTIQASANAGTIHVLAQFIQNT